MKEPERKPFIQINSFEDAQKYLFILIQEGELMIGPKYKLVEMKTGKKYLEGTKEWLKSAIKHQKLRVL
jgi:hypothetical protein